jgi:hypothetical protein
MGHGLAGLRKKFVQNVRCGSGSGVAVVWQWCGSGVAVVSGVAVAVVQYVVTATT